MGYAWRLNVGAITWKQGVFAYFFVLPYWSTGMGAFWKMFGLYNLSFNTVSAMFRARLLSVPRSSKVHIRMAMPVIIGWFLWKARNHAYFQNIKVPVRQIIMQIDSYLHQLGIAGILRQQFFRGEADCRFKDYAPWR